MKIIFEVDLPDHDGTAAMAETILDLLKLLGRSAAIANCSVALTVDGAAIED